VLAELGLYLITRVPRPVRRLGLLRESVGLWSRSSRQRAAWAPHYARCRAVVAQAVRAIGHGRTVLVLGSGLVRDVPVDLLAARFERVVLVDAVHLPTVRLRLARHRNLVFDRRDLTGALDWLAGRVGGRVAPLEDYLADDSVDLVISANLLSQLPIPLDNWIERQNGRAERFPEDVPARAVRWHLDDLARFRCPVCLLSDVEMREEDREGKVGERLDLLHGACLPVPDEAWDWPVAPFGEIERDFAYIHRVHAYARLDAAPLAAALDSSAPGPCPAPAAEGRPAPG
jgi:hypothetical protein